MLTSSVFAAVAVAISGLGSFAATGDAETVQRGKLRVRFNGKLTPNRLPRHGTRAVAVSIGGRVGTTDGSEPPQLRRIELSLNRHGLLEFEGLPTCRLEQIQPSTTRQALRACGRAKVGEGLFFASVAIPGQAPFPSRGKVIAFNGVEDGRRVIFAHVYGDEPVPTSYTVPFVISRSGGAFATKIAASLPRVTGKAGFITGIQLNLHRTYRHRGKRRSYLSAGCPAPQGVGLVPFNLARATFVFAGRRLSSVLTRRCRARG